MREGFEKKDNKKPKLGLIAGAAMLAGVATNAEAANITILKTRVTNPPVTMSEQNKETAWFEKKVGALGSLEKEDLSKMEKTLASMPLKLQVKFLEETLKAGGVYFREFAQSNLTPERLSQIYKLVNEVSARMTLEYADHPGNSELKSYFADVDTLRNATRRYDVYQNGIKMACNKFAAQDENEVYVATAFHCIEGTELEKDYFHYPKSDVAVKYLPQKDWKEMDIQDPASLPKVAHVETPEDATGRVATSFSWGPDGAAKVHISFSMPLPANKFLVFNPGNFAALGPWGVKDWMMFFKPYSEGQIKPETGKTNSGGSSGGPVSVAGRGILGNYSATREITDRCANLCYAASFFSGPDIFQKTMAGERARRTSTKATQ